MFENQPIGVTVNAIIMGLGGIVSILAGLGIILLGAAFGASLGLGADAAAAGGVLGLVVGFLGFFLLIIGVIELFIAKKILEHKNWARIVASIFAVLSLIGFPLGTILGAVQLYFFWFHAESKAVYS